MSEDSRMVCFGKVKPTALRLGMREDPKTGMFIGMMIKFHCEFLDSKIWKYE